MWSYCGHFQLHTQVSKKEREREPKVGHEWETLHPTTAYTYSHIVKTRVCLNFAKLVANSGIHIMQKL